MKDIFTAPTSTFWTFEVENSNDLESGAEIAEICLFLGFSSNNRVRVRIFEVTSGNYIFGTGYEKLLPLSSFRLKHRAYVLSRGLYERRAPWPRGVYFSAFGDLPLDDDDDVLRSSKEIQLAILKGMKPLLPKKGITSVKVPMSEAVFRAIFEDLGAFETIKKTLSFGSITYTPSPQGPVRPEEYGIVMEIAKMSETKAFKAVDNAKQLGISLTVARGLLPSMKAKEKRFKGLPFREAAKLKCYDEFTCEENVLCIDLSKHISELDNLLGPCTSRKEKNMVHPTYFIAPRENETEVFFKAFYLPTKGVAMFKFSYVIRPF